MNRIARAGVKVLVAAALFASISISAALASTSIVTYYLVGDSEPVGSLSQSSPPGGPLPNFDPDRDNNALGLVLKETDKGMAETDPEKHQQWAVVSPGLEMSGNPTFRIWTAMKDFKDDKDGVFTVYLLDCAGISTSCTVLRSTTASRDQGSGWSQVVVGFSSIEHTFASGRSLAVRVVVTKDSEDDMWFAYHTSTYPSRLEIPIPLVVTTTTTKPPTTTTLPGTTTTTLPGTTTTTLPSSTTTTTLPGTTTTTLPSSTTTIEVTSTTEAITGPVSPTTSTPASPDARPVNTATEKSSLVVQANAPDPTEDLFGTDQRLSPQEGLMVSFLTAAETVRSQLLASAGLGAIGSLLLVFGMRRRMDDAGQ